LSRFGFSIPSGVISYIQERIMEIIKPTHRITKTNLVVQSGNPKGSSIFDINSRITHAAAA